MPKSKPKAKQRTAARPKIDLMVGISFKFPMRVTMPCLNEVVINSPKDIPLFNKPCPCGDPHHIAVMVSPPPEKVQPNHSPGVVTQGELEAAVRRALNIFDQWTEATGYFPMHTSIYYEIQALIENGVHCGIQQALGVRETLEGETDKD